MDKRSRLWADWFDAEFSSLYYARLVRFYDHIDTTIRFVVTLASSAAFVTLVTNKAPTIAPWAALVAAVLSTVSLIYGFGKKSDRAADLHARFAKLADEYEQLWDQLEEGAPGWEDAWRRAREADLKCVTEAAKLIVIPSFQRSAYAQTLQSRPQPAP